MTTRRRNRWAVYACYEHPEMVDVPDKPGWKQMAPGAKPSYYGVADVLGDGEDDETRFETEEHAQAHADERNRFDREGPLDPAFEHRRRNLARVPGDLFSVRYGDADPPNRPERYAAVVCSERYGESFVDLHDDLEAAFDPSEPPEAIYDLETGEQIEFEVSFRVTCRSRDDTPA